MSFDLLKSEIIDKDLCEGCGLCAGFCKAITLEDSKPALTGRCMLRRGSKNCGLCYELCPQAHPEQIATDDLAPLMTSSVQTKDPKILEVASNGGFVTTLLKYLLKKNKIKAVVAVTGEKRSPAAITVAAAKDTKTLAGTRYSPSGVLNEFAEALRNYGNEIAVVALPCEMRGVARMEEKLQRQVLKIGLFCSNNNRTGDDGKIVKLGSCAHCTDFFGKHADVSCGFAGSEKGFTTVVSLTEQGNDALNLALKADLFDVKECDMSKVKAAQTRKSKREIASPAKTLRERVLDELNAGPGEIDALAERLGVIPDDIIYHLLILQNQGLANSQEGASRYYSVLWSAK